tara:strand:+ start:68 stop:967 length:900 start_codon:yes stop_codon:yes gene_type:complete
MKIVIAGGTGGIGKHLVSALKDYHEIIILSRSKSQIISKKLQIINYSTDIESWCKALNNTDVIINLAGEPIVAKRWSKKQKQIILDSRLNSIKQISKALKIINHNPQLIMNASAIGYYSYSSKRQNEHNKNGSHFSSKVCVEWENKAVQDFSSQTKRLVILRMGIVLDSKSGILLKLCPLFRYGLGAIIGSGKQIFPWVDIDDVVESIKHIIKLDIKGPVNIVAPSEDDNYRFSKILGKVLGRPVFIRIPSFILKIFLGEMSDSVVNSSNIYPSILLKSGYQFRFAKLYDSVNKNYTKE